MRPMKKRIVGMALSLVAGGTLFQLGSCSVGSALGYISGLNPCGSILACDPVTYRFLTSGYRGPGADPTIDPTCTYPPYCAGDPFVQTLTTP